MKKHLSALWSLLLKPSAWIFLGAGALIGFAVFGIGSAAMQYTMTQDFCTSCHEMRDNVYAEYKDSIHDSNRTGVRAICADCHVPREPVDKWIRKVKALGELYQHFVVGKIDTREKFEAHRAELAKKVWTRMKETDSRECRHCHNEQKMSAELQSEKAQHRHQKGREEGLTCIECHYGIAHTEPEGEGPRELNVKRTQ